MQLVRNFNNIPKCFLQGTVFTIGDFDGVHLGHQKLLETIVQDAKKLNLLSAILIFEPQPQEYFAKFNAPCRLTNMREKIFRLKQTGVDYVVVHTFNKKFSEFTAEQFIKDILVKKLHIKEIVIGHDFRFGSKRSGDFALLNTKGEQYGFIVKQISAFTRDDQIISSSFIRSLLNTYDFEKVEKILGRKYSIIGKICDVYRCKSLSGIAIVSITMKRHKFPLKDGIYRIRSHGLIHTSYGIGCIITDSTKNRSKIYLEISLLELQGTVFRKQLEVEFHEYLQPLDAVISDNEPNKEILVDIFSTKKII